MAKTVDRNLLTRLLPSVLMLLVISVFVAARPASAVDLTFSCDSPGCLFVNTDTLSVSVDIDAGTTDLRGASLSILFDSGAVMPVAVEAGSLWDDSSCSPFLSWLNPGSPDSVYADLGGLGCSVDGPGSILVIKFTCVSPSPGVLSCGTNYLRNSANTALPYTCTPTTVQCEIPTAAEATTWSLIKAMYSSEGHSRQ